MTGMARRDWDSLDMEASSRTWRIRYIKRLVSRNILTDGIKKKKKQKKRTASVPNGSFLPHCSRCCPQITSLVLTASIHSSNCPSCSLGQTPPSSSSSSRLPPIQQRPAPDRIPPHAHTKKEKSSERHNNNNNNKRQREREREKEKESRQTFPWWIKYIRLFGSRPSSLQNNRIRTVSYLECDMDPRRLERNDPLAAVFGRPFRPLLSDSSWPIDNIWRERERESKDRSTGTAVFSYVTLHSRCIFPSHSIFPLDRFRQTVCVVYSAGSIDKDSVKNSKR